MTNATRVCLVGAGRAGQVHAESLTHHVLREACGLRGLERCGIGETCARFGVESRFNSLEKAIDSVAFDAVVITTPTSTHRELVAAAATHGKHISARSRWR